MPGEWLDALRAVARRMREELLELSDRMPPPRDAARAKELEKEADGLACRALLEGLEETGLSCILVCEDLGVREIGSPGPEGPFLVVDPLDGTRNFTRGVQIASISMALCDGPDLAGLREGLVLDIFSGREFWAVRGEGAFSDGRPIRVAETEDLSKAVLSIDQSRAPEADWVPVVVGHVDAVRQLGSASLELCLVASGVLDGHIDLRGRIRIVDVAAGLLIAREAGACAWLRGSSGREVALRPEEKVRILVANPGLLGKLMEILKPYLPGEGMLLRPSSQRSK